MAASEYTVSRRPSMDTRRAGPKCQITYSPQSNQVIMRPLSRFCEMNRAASASGAQLPGIGRQVEYGTANRATGTAIATIPTTVTTAMPGCGAAARVGSRVAHALANCG